MVMSAAHQVWPKLSCKVLWKGEEEKACERGKKTRQTEEEVEDNIREWTGLEFGKSQRAVEKKEKMEETGCEIICGAPTTFAVKG